VINTSIDQRWSRKNKKKLGYQIYIIRTDFFQNCLTIFPSSVQDQMGAHIRRWLIDPWPLSTEVLAGYMCGIQRAGHARGVTTFCLIQKSKATCLLSSRHVLTWPECKARTYLTCEKIKSYKRVRLLQQISFLIMPPKRTNQSADALDFDPPNKND